MKKDGKIIQNWFHFIDKGDNLIKNILKVRQVIDLYIVNESYTLNMAEKKFSNLKIMCRNTGTELAYIDKGSQELIISLALWIVIL